MSSHKPAHKPRRKPAKRKQWSELVFFCPNCETAHVLKQPVPAIAYGMHLLPKKRG